MATTDPLDDIVANVDVSDIVRASNSQHLLPAIAVIEDLEDAEMTLDIFQMLCTGLDSGELSKDIMLSEKKSMWLTDYVAKIVKRRTRAA